MQNHRLGAIPVPLASRDYERPVRPIARLNAALESRYRIEREIGEGGMAGVEAGGAEPVMRLPGPIFISVGDTWGY